MYFQAITGISLYCRCQYVLLGDPLNMTDNMIFEGHGSANTPPVGLPGSPDDRWVFTEDNPYRELQTAAALAAASRVMRSFNPGLSAECLRIAREVYDSAKERDPLHRLSAAVELLLASGEKRYADWIIGQRQNIVLKIERTGWVVAPVLGQLNNKRFTESVKAAVKEYAATVARAEKENPYGVPYKPDIWGAGWEIQALGVNHFSFTPTFRMFSPTAICCMR
jgi:endoglucanase